MSNGVKDTVKVDGLQWLIGPPGAGAAVSLAAPVTAIFTPNGENTLKFHCKYTDGAAGVITFAIRGEDIVTPGTFPSETTYVDVPTGNVPNRNFFRTAPGATDDFEFSIPFAGKRKYRVTVSHATNQGAIRVALEGMVSV